MAIGIFKRRYMCWKLAVTDAPTVLINVSTPHLQFGHLIVSFVLCQLLSIC